MEYWWRDASGYNEELTHYEFHSNFPDSIMDAIGYSFSHNGRCVEGGALHGDIFTVDWISKNLKLTIHVGPEVHYFNNDQLDTFYFWYLHNGDLDNHFVLEPNKFAIVQESENIVVHLFWEMVPINSDWIKEGF